MKKILNSILIIILSLTLVACDMDSDVKPRNRLNTNWVSDNPRIFFTVTQGEGHKDCLGRLEDSDKIYNIAMDFDFGREVNIIDYDILKENDFVMKSKYILVKGDCKFSEKKCVVTITESNIDSLKVDDKITFKLVEELPDWANETELWN